MASPVAGTTPPPPPSEVVEGDEKQEGGGTTEVLLCDGCRCPIGPLWDVLPAEETAPVWKQHVYSYELDLFNNGAAPVQAYSATNPAARRFDLLRLAPHVTVHGPAVSSPSTPSATPAAAASSASSSSSTVQAPSLVECQTGVYSSEHSFFPGYAWCFAHCSNCGAFVGWGFAAESRLRAAQQQQKQQDNSGEDSGRLRKRAKRRSEDVLEGGTSTRDASASSTADALASSSSPSPPPPREGASVETPNTQEGEEEEEGHHATSNSSSSNSSVERGADSGVADGADPHERVVDTTAVTPDFIGIVITYCTGEPEYPVAALLRDVQWRAARHRRCSAVAALRNKVQSLLRHMTDGYRAYQLYYDFSTVEQLTYTIPPPSELPTSTSISSDGNTNPDVAALLATVDDDGVPQRLHAVLRSTYRALTRMPVGRGDGSSTSTSSTSSDGSSG